MTAVVKPGRKARGPKSTGRASSYPGLWAGKITAHH